MIDLLQLSLTQISLAIAIIFIAYTVKGLSGFGSGLVAIPLLAFVFPLSMIVPILGLLSYSGTIYQSLVLRRQVAWRDILPLLPFALGGIVIALWLLVNVAANTLTLILGIFIFLYSLYSMISLNQLKAGRRWAIPAGALAGLVGALFGTGGPFYVLYLTLRQLDKTQFRASIAMIFLIDGGARIWGYAASGLYTQQGLLLVLILLPVLFIGMVVGHQLHGKIDQGKFNQLVSILLSISGIMLIIKSLG